MPAGYYGGTIHKYFYKTSRETLAMTKPISPKSMVILISCTSGNPIACPMGVGDMEFYKQFILGIQFIVQ